MNTHLVCNAHLQQSIQSIDSRFRGSQDLGRCGAFRKGIHSLLYGRVSD
jgi:hypothetical protein